MMCFLSLTTLLLFTTPDIDIKRVVKEFHELNTKESEETFINSYKLSTEPSILAYVCAIEMKQAEYSYNPLTKLKTFNRTKRKLSELIVSNPTNVHLRYIRLVLQEKTPSILGYKDFIDEDKSFLSKKLEISDESDYLDFYIHNNTSL